MSGGRSVRELVDCCQVPVCQSWPFFIIIIGEGTFLLIGMLADNPKQISRWTVDGKCFLDYFLPFRESQVLSRPFLSFEQVFWRTRVCLGAGYRVGKRHRWWEAGGCNLCQ